MNKKKELARTAVTFIKDNDIVGLGASTVMPFIADILAEEIANGLRLQLVTSSSVTAQLILQRRLAVQYAADFEKINIYIDGCDQFDHELNALKSGGGIHTMEKLLASMAKLFILVGDETKYVENFSSSIPLVIEVLPDAILYVPAKIQGLFPAVSMSFGKTDKKEATTILKNGNHLLDILFAEWPDPQYINPLIKGITGVVETSLFTNLAHKAIISTKDDRIEFVDK